LHKEIGVGQNLPEIRKQFDTGGAAVMQMSPAQFGSYMVADVEKWGQVVKDAGIKARWVARKRRSPPASRWQLLVRKSPGAPDQQGPS